MICNESIIPDAGSGRRYSIVAAFQQERKTMSIPEVDGQPVTREALVQGLQEDIAREYQAIIQYVIFSQKLDGARYQEIAQILEGHAHEELDHAIAIARQLDYFGAYPVHQPATVTVSDDNDLMLWADLDAEDETIKEYRKRIRQAQALGEYALAEVLQEIIKQEQDHQIELASALGIVPDPNGRKETSPFKK
jgi:bacterioferritin